MNPTTASQSDSGLIAALVEARDRERLANLRLAELKQYVRLALVDLHMLRAVAGGKIGENVPPRLVVAIATLEGALVRAGRPKTELCSGCGATGRLQNGERCPRCDGDGLDSRAGQAR